MARGQDYFVRDWQKGPYSRRKLFFTERGGRRLALKAYRVFRPGPASASQQTFIARMDAAVRFPQKGAWVERVPAGGHPLAVIRAVRDRVARVMRHLKHPCAAGLRAYGAQAETTEPGGASYRGIPQDRSR